MNVSGARRLSASAWTFGTAGLPWIARAVVVVASAAIVYRAVGTFEFGLWAIGATLRSFLLVLDVGLGLPAIRDSAAPDDHPGRPARLAATIRLYRAMAVVAVLAGITLAPIAALLAAEAGWSALAAGVTIGFALEAALTLVSSPAVAILRGRGLLGPLGGAHLAWATITLALMLLWTPSQGLPGAVGAMLVGRLLLSGGLAWWMRREGLGASGGKTARQSIVRSSLPLWAVVIASQVGFASDVPVVGILHGAAAAGVYSVGVTPPGFVASLIFSVMDAIGLRQASVLPAARPALLHQWCTIGCFVGVLLVGLVAIEAEDVLAVWIGNSPTLSVDVLRLYAVVWIANVPTHAVVLALIATDQLRRLVGLATVEAGASLVVSVILAVALGPIGPAIATLATVALSNAILVPLVGSRWAGTTASEIWRASLRGVAVGAIGLAGPALVAIALSSTPSVIRLIATGGAAGIVLVVALAVWPTRGQAASA